MNKCKTCGKKCEGEFCFRHKRKSIDVEAINKRNNFFSLIWKKRSHYCENCGRWLGNEPLSYFFDHILEKNKYPSLTFVEENIMLLCMECHEKKSRGFYSEKIELKREQLKKLL